MSSAKRNHRRRSRRRVPRAIADMEEQATILLDELRGPVSDQGFTDQAETVLSALQDYRDRGRPLTVATEQYLARAVGEEPVHRLMGNLWEVVAKYATTHPSTFSRAVFARFTEGQITLKQTYQLLGALAPVNAIQATRRLEQLIQQQQASTAAAEEEVLARHRAKTEQKPRVATFDVLNPQPRKILRPSKKVEPHGRRRRSKNAC